MTAVRNSSASELASAVASASLDLGAGAAFGVPGGGPNLELVGAVQASGQRFVLMHGETAACIAAGTYGLLSGRPGLALATRGPGAASAVNGAAQATLDRFPLVLVTDTVPEAHRNRFAHQRVDQVRMLGPATKWSGVIGSSEPEAVARSAFALAASAPAGAVHLDADATAAGSRPIEHYDIPSTDPEAIAAANEAISSATRPLAIVGCGASHAVGAVRNLVERLGCPALTTYQAAGIIPYDSPANAGLFTNGASERNLIEQADLILTIGLDTVEPIPAAWEYDAPVVAFTEVPLDGYHPKEVEVFGDIGAALAAVTSNPRTSNSNSSWAPAMGAEARTAVQHALRSPADGLAPVELVETAVDCAPSDALATVDAGAHFFAAMPFWPAGAPNELLISNGLATMGFAVPAAIGATLARPGRPVVCFVGDGGLGMTLAELETIARLELPITVIVLNDSTLSLIALKQGPAHGGADAVAYSPTNFAQIANGMGLAATVTENAAELRKALATGWEGPRLIDARIDPSPYAHLMKVTRG